MTKAIIQLINMPQGLKLIADDFFSSQSLECFHIINRSTGKALITQSWVSHHIFFSSWGNYFIIHYFPRSITVSCISYKQHIAMYPYTFNLECLKRYSQDYYNECWSYHFIGEKRKKHRPDRLSK